MLGRPSAAVLGHASRNRPKMRAKLRRSLGRAVRRLRRTAKEQTPTTATWTTLPFDAQTEILWERVRLRTMTSIERIDALRASVEYVVKNTVPGDFVECGVWRGGSMIAIALTLQRIGAQRRLWLYDTFSGMPPPGRDDFDFRGRSAQELMAQENPETSYIWAKSSLDDVKLGLRETGYAEDAIEFVVGPVESTLPNRAPEKIALLRLDTDWFESTYCELVHLWPRLVDGGVLIIDDYGDWAGAKKAADSYFAEQKLFPLLHRVDPSARVIVKRVS